MSGTSIGGIIASALSIPEDPEDITNREPKFYSDEVTEIGRKMTDFAFDKNVVMIGWL
jgi:hypothetical protein